MAEIEKISVDSVVYDISDANAVKNIQMNGSTLTKSSGTVNLGTVITDVSNKQDTLVSGTNIKTINNTSLLGSGNITINADTSDCEKTVNKVTSLSSASTDTEYPSAKLLYDSLAGKVTYSTDRVSDANNFTTIGYALTSASIPTANLPSVCTGSDRWGVLFWIEENAAFHAGTQMYFPIDGTYKGRIFYRSSGNATWSAWELIPKTSDLPTGVEVTTNKVTSLSSSSTDTQYPSAKCVYDIVGDIETLINAL